MRDRLQELVRSFVSCGKPVAPTGLQLADGLTKDKGEAAECLRRSLRSGSYMLRGEEEVMQERHFTRVQELSASEESSTTEKS